MLGEHVGAAFNLAVDGKRQPGSTFKTFVLAEAVRRGINPWSTQYLSAPFDGPESQGKPWQVETYDRTYLGRTAIAGATPRRAGRSDAAPNSCKRPIASCRTK